MRRTIAVLVAAMLVAVADATAGCSTAGCSTAGCSTGGVDAVAGQVAPSTRGNPCDFAEADSLGYLTVGGDVAAQMAQPFVFDRVDCAGTTAIAYTMADGVTPVMAVRFQYSVGMWRPIAVHPATTRPDTMKENR
ncbi:hypothetical protein [Gordonia sp. MP11Mi]|uniref:Lipoprotein n=1 Tax=Gordonia sp. MP11Mi TaxID=3022769 RepID=A0AA97CUN5_9ACTN